MIERTMSSFGFKNTLERDYIRKCIRNVQEFSEKCVRDKEELALVYEKHDCMEPDIEKVDLVALKYSSSPVIYAHRVIVHWDGKERIIKDRNTPKAPAWSID